MAGRSGQVRIIGGKWKGRKLRFPLLPGLRPTPGRLRETLFNWLGESIVGASCLDLCAGSGALGLESLSRGAASVDFVERDRRACHALQASISTLDGAAEVFRVDARRFLASSQHQARRWDIIFFDPPFASAMRDDLLPKALACLRGPGARLCLEMPSQRAPQAGNWRLLRTSHAGDTTLLLLASADTDTIAALRQEESAK